MAEFQEGQVLTNDRGDEIILQNNQWMPVVGRNPQTGEPITSFEQVFEPPRIPTPVGALQTFIEGAGLGFGDEAVGLMGEIEKNLLAAVPGTRIPTTPRGALEETAAEARRQFEEQQGKLAAGLTEGAGALTTALLTRGLGTEGMIARSPLLGGAAAGGLFGGITGAGKAEPGERLTGALSGAALGGALGGALTPVAGFLGRRVLSPLTRKAAQFGESAGQQARRIVSEQLQGSFNTLQQAITAAKKVGPQGTLLDISETMRGIGQGLATKFPKYRHAITNKLMTRAQGSHGRLNSLLNKTLGGTGKDFKQTYSAMLQKARVDSGDLYDAAMAQTVSRETIENFGNQLDDIAAAEASPVRRFLTTFKKELSMPDDAVGIKVEKMQNVRDVLTRKMGNLVDTTTGRIKEGQSKLYGKLANIRDQFDTMMPDEYIQANQIYSDDASVMTAMNWGRKILRGGEGADVIADRVSKMNESERNAYLIGAARAIRDKVMRKPEGSKVGSFLTPEVKERLQVAIPDADDFDNFIQGVETENVFDITKNLIIANSQTAQRMAASDAITKAIEANTPPTSIADATARTARWLFDNSDQLSDDVLDELTRTVTKSGPNDEFIRKLFNTPLRTRIPELADRLGQRTRAAIAPVAGEVSQ